MVFSSTAVGCKCDFVWSKPSADQFDGSHIGVCTLGCIFHKNSLSKTIDAKDNRSTNADAKVLPVLGKPQVMMLELAGIIGKHLKAE